MNSSVVLVDWFFLGVLCFSLLLGALRGLVFEVLSVLSWVGAFALAQWLALDVTKTLPMSTANASIQYLAGFILVFVVTVFVGGLLAKAGSHLFAAVGLAPADRALGGIFGLVRGVVFLLATTVAIGMTPMRNDEDWQASVGAGFSLAALRGLTPMLPEKFAKYLLP